MSATNIQDSEVDNLLWKAGMTPAEIEACRAAYPEVKLVLWGIQQMVANRIAQRLVEKLFPEHGVQT